MSSTEPEPHSEPETPTSETQTSEPDPTTDSVDETPGDAAAPEIEIEDVVDRSTVRRAPRYKAFFLTGAVVGILIGVGFGAYLLSLDEAQGLLKPGVYFSVVVLGVTTATVLLAGLLAILADRRSLRRRGR